MAKDSKTFCPYPWIHVMTHPVGTMSFCCVASNQLKHDGLIEVDGVQTGKAFLLGEGDKMSDAWNGEHMRMIRRQMDTGEHVIGCEPCYDLERYGIPSYRENYIKDWMGFHREAEHIQQIIDRSRENDYYVDEEPMYLDFRLGTMCNLRCRMCQSQNSSAIHKDLENEYTEEEKQFVVD